MSRASDQIGRGHAIEAHRFHSTLILVRVWFVFTLLGLVAGIALAFVTNGEADRQLAVDPQTVDYLATRIERSAAAARTVVAKLDRAALSEKRRITRPLVRQVLGIGDGQT